MDGLKPDKSFMRCSLAMAIMVVGYASERLMTSVITPDKTFALVLAIVYTALFGLSFFLVFRSKDYFSGMLSALLGYKLMPPSIAELSVSPEGNLLYFIVRRVAAVLFVLLVLKFYEMQEKPRAIKPIPLLAIMLLVPFFNEISSQVGNYFLYITGTMLSVYFTDFVCYALAIVITVLFAYRVSYESLVFTADFEYIVISINILRRVAVVVLYLIRGQHISRSFYVWIALYVALIVFILLLKKHKQHTVIKDHN